MAKQNGVVEPEQLRTSVRFPMRLPLTVKTAEGSFEATTEDISANGILFSGPDLPKLNSHIDFTINMPASVMGTADDVLIHCVGRIVRHESRDGEMQAAAIIDEYSLRV
jgi:hypothetical protein